MGNIKFRPGYLVIAAINYMAKRELLGDHLNKKMCIHIAPNDDGEIELHVHKKSDGSLECDMCHRKIYKRFDQSAIDIVDRCMRVILSSRLLAFDFANRLHPIELIARIHIDEFYQARYVIEHRFAQVRQLLKELVTYVITYEKDPEKHPPINDETENPEHLSSDITPISGNDVTLIDECISVIDQLLIFGMPNGLHAHVQDELLMFRSALHDLVEDLENSDDMNK